MKSFIFKSSFILFYFILLSYRDFLASANDEMFDQYKAKIVELGKANRYDEAFDVLEKAKKEFRTEHQFPATLTYHIAQSYYKSGKLAEAEALLEHAVREYSYDWLWAFYSTVLIKREKEEYALNILNRFPNQLDSFSEDLKQKPVDVLTAYHLAASYALINDKDLAFKYLNGSVFGGDPKPDDLFERTAKDVDLDSLRNDERFRVIADYHSAKELADLGSLYNSQGKYSEAEELLTKAVEIQEQTIGPFHPELSITLHNLAYAHHWQGRLSEAESLYLRSLTIVENSLGLDHPYAAETFYNLGGLCKGKKDYAQAESFYKKALEIFESYFGFDDPRVGSCLHELAHTYQSQGEHAEAAQFYQRAISIFKRTLGPDHPDTKTALENYTKLLNNGTVVVGTD